MKTNLINKIIVGGIVLLLAACNSRELPILGPRTLDDNGDTIYHKIADFSLKNQYGEEIGKEDIRGKVVVADFFFTSCPTICPDMKEQLMRIHEKLGSRDDFMIVSHTVDPEHDTVEVLRKYSEKLGLNREDGWYFLTGDIDSVYTLGEKSYMVAASEDPEAPGGYLHSGAFILVDRKGRIRAYYDGTNPEKVDQLRKDVELLLDE